jgi:O-methyltransferase involved in polyketide biosynthesis
MDRIPPADSYLFLAEGIFPYFDESDVRRAITTLADRFPGSEMIVDALSPFMVHSSMIVPSFRGYHVRPRWGVSDPRKIESWGNGICLLDTWGYFDEPEPRLKDLQWMARIPMLRNIARVLHLRLGQSRF